LDRTARACGGPPLHSSRRGATALVREDETFAACGHAAIHFADEYLFDLDEDHFATLARLLPGVFHDSVRPVNHCRRITSNSTDGLFAAALPTKNPVLDARDTISAPETMAPVHGLSKRYDRQPRRPPQYCDGHAHRAVDRLIDPAHHGVDDRGRGRSPWRPLACDHEPARLGGRRNPIPTLKDVAL
jgi:hypothetical protein